jgi:hypothetical protein
MTVDAVTPDGRARHSRRELAPARLGPLSAGGST